MNVYIIDVRGGNVVGVTGEDLEPVMFIVRDNDLKRFDNGMPSLVEVGCDVDRGTVAATLNRHINEDKSDLAVHGQEG